MSFPDIDVTELTVSGLGWLFLTYGYVLYFASSLISEGSDLLLLVPAYAGIVGSCVLPVLGAVPDGAIMLFSGMGDLEEAQEELAVGVGALAGSTIMLLTIPWALAAFSGRVDLDETGNAKYGRRPKLTPGKAWKPFGCGVCPGKQVRSGAIAMTLTSVSYVVIQAPAFALSSVSDPAEVAAGEHWYALIGLCTTLFGFVGYLTFQVATSGSELDTKQFRADEIIKRKVQRGELSLSGAMAEFVARDTSFAKSELEMSSGAAYQAVQAVAGEDETATRSSFSGNKAASARLGEIVKPFFAKIDSDNSGKIDKTEAKVLLDQLGEQRTTVEQLFAWFDLDNSGEIDFDEFVAGLSKKLKEMKLDETTAAISDETEEEDDDEEEEDVPEDIADLSPAEQQAVIKHRALFKLVIGTALVLVFSDPMVDVMSEIGARTGIPKFYVSFVLAPLASNASELIAAYYYALKKTSKTITISFTALEGAASMNNTFCLSIFMGLIFFRGIAWQYSAETISILLVQILVALIALFKKVQTLFDAFLVILIYPFSIAVVYVLENKLGLD